MTRSFIALLAALPLIACTPAADKADTGEVVAKEGGVGDGPTGRVGNPVARGADKGPIPDDIDEGVENAANQTAPDAATKPTSIPTRFHGRWGLTANDCKPEFASAAKGLMVVGDRQLTFYESRGTLDRIDSWTPANRFTANYGFSGEGMTWERVITFERNGAKLRRTEKGGDEGPVDLTYTACPA